MIVEATMTVVFYVLAASAVAFALAVVIVRRLLHAAICLMGVLLASAGLYLMLSAEFLAGIQVVVYVGGIVVLIVFTVMLTRSADLLEDSPTLRRKVLGAIASNSMLWLMVAVFWTSRLAPTDAGVRPRDDTSAIGRKLLDFGPGGYVLPFEIISLLLLAAAIGGIVVARKIPPRDQPFTSGGDLPGEAEARYPRSQREATVKRETR